MNDFLNTLIDAIVRLKTNLPISIGFLAILFGIHCLNWMLGYRLNYLGIHPRKLFGWIGIPFSPFLHGNLPHLMFNSLPLFVFANFIILQSVSLFYAATICIIVLSGTLIWVFGRPGIHIGASSLIMGYLGFITINIYYKPTTLSIIVGAVCIYYFGGIFSNLSSSGDKKVSWEGHVLGFIAGMVTAPLLAQYTSL